MRNKFFKAHALGNDFLLVKTNNLDSIDGDFVLTWNNRFFGIGFNQLLVVNKENMVRIWDEDGTHANLCGNGLRCLAKLFGSQEITFETERAGPVYLENLTNGLVSMCVKKKAVIIQQKNHYIVDIGNANKIFFVEDNSKINMNLYANNHFNYSFISRKKNKWLIRTIESCTRGETFACGSAALAAACLMIELGYEDLTLHYRLGAISHIIKDSNITQIGPATIVAELFFLY